MGTALALCLISITGGCRSVEFLKKEAANGNTKAQLELVRYYRTHKNKSAERFYLKMAADNKYPEAVKELALRSQSDGNVAQATSLHIDYVNLTGETAIAKEWLAELISGGTFEKLASAVLLAEALLRRSTDQANIAANIADLQPLRRAVEQFYRKNKQKENFRQAFELLRDFRALTEKFQGLEQLAVFPSEEESNTQQVPASQITPVKKTISAAPAKNSPPRTKEKKSAKASVKQKKTPPAAPAKKLPPRSEEKKSTIASAELKKIVSSNESVRFIQKKWMRFIELLNQKSSFTQLENEISQGAGSCKNTKEKGVFIVKYQFPKYSVRYFFRNFTAKGKKDTSSLCRIEVIPAANEFENFSNDLRTLFAGTPLSEETLQLHDFLWACTFKLSAAVRSVSEKGVSASLCQKAEISDFREIRMQTPQYESWLKFMKTRVNSNGYIAVENKKTVEYYRPEDIIKWFAVTPQNKESILKQISSSDTAAGKIVFNVEHRSAKGR